MKNKEKTMYADFIMGMRMRGKHKFADNIYIPENRAAEILYGEKYEVIRDDFTERVSKELSRKRP